MPPPLAHPPGVTPARERVREGVWGDGERKRGRGRDEGQRERGVGDRGTEGWVS